MMENLEENRIASFKRGLSWIELKEAFKNEGCPICFIMLEHLNKYFDHLLYEEALSVSVHKKMIAGMGLCNTHTWVLAKSTDKLGIGSLFQTTLSKEIKLLKRINEFECNELLSSSRNKKKLDKDKKVIEGQLTAKGKCLACEHQEESEIFYLHQLLIIWNDKEFREYYENENVLLCRKHFQLLLQESDDEENMNYFITIQKNKIDNLSYQYSEFMRKHDYRFQHEMTDKDKASLNRVLEYFGSKKYINPK